MSRRPLAQRYWDAYESSLDPPEGSAARNLARIRERLAAGDSIDDAPPPVETDTRRAAASVVLLGKSAAASVGIATATLLAIKLAAVGWGQLAAPPPSAEPGVGPSERAPAKGTPEVRRHAEDPSPPAANEPTAAEPRSEAPARVEGDPRSVETRRRADTPAEDRLRAEVALMDRARGALDRGDAHALWQLMDEHARRFPTGALAEERQAWRAVAACGLGHAHAAARAERFLAAHPRSPQADKVRRACEAATEIE